MEIGAITQREFDELKILFTVYNELNGIAPEHATGSSSSSSGGSSSSDCESDSRAIQDDSGVDDSVTQERPEDNAAAQVKIKSCSKLDVERPTP